MTRISTSVAVRLCQLIARRLSVVLLALSFGASAAWGQLGVPGYILIDGLAPFSNTGAAVAFGDFNGDGIDDLVMGAPGLSSAGVPDVGGIRVIPGTMGGLVFLFTLRPGDLAGGEDEFGGYFGASLAVGDFDADGFDDLAVGIPGKDVNGHDDAGSVAVLYGMTGKFILGGAQFFSQAPLSGAVEAGDRFGATLTAGDLSGDGVDDLVIGVIGENVQVGGLSVSDAGAVNVVYGQVDVGLTTAGNLLVHHQIAGVDGTGGVDDQFGFALAIGEFTGDTFQDLAVGIPGMGDFLVGGEDGFGGVRILRGAAGGIDLSPSEPLWFQGTPGILGTETDDDAFGTALAAGDYDGDGTTDLAVGVPGEDEFGPNGSGAVQILYGRPGIGLDPLGDQFFTESLFDGDVDAFDGFGQVLAAGDFDVSGHDDLAIGAPLDNSLGFNNAGEVSVLYGTESGLSVAGAQLMNMIFFGGLQVADRFGAALATGRFNAVTGGPGVAVGVPSRAVDGDFQVGSVVVVFSKSLFNDGFESADTSAWSVTVD